MRMIKRGDRWSLEPAGQLLDKLCVDAVPRLHIGEDESPVIIVSIGGPYELVAPDGHRTGVDPDDDLANVAPLLRLVRRYVVRLDAFNDGRLEFDFDDDTRVLVNASDKIENWQINGPDGLLIVSVPGDSLAVWPSRSEEPR